MGFTLRPLGNRGIGGPPVLTIEFHLKVDQAIDDQGQREISLDYIIVEVYFANRVTQLDGNLNHTVKTQHLSCNTGNWVGLEVSILLLTGNDAFVHGLG